MIELTSLQATHGILFIQGKEQHYCDVFCFFLPALYLLQPSGWFMLLFGLDA
jgi:hypothetical protein